MGLVYFGAVKLAGYTAAAVYLKKRQFPESKVSPWLVGGVRTVLGLVAGVGAVFAAEQLGLIRAEFGFYVLLVPIRMGEWLILLALFFRRPEWRWSRALKLAAIGTVWSFVLDVPAILAVFVIPGGMWIC
jgi:hypothetical protein